MSRMILFRRRKRGRFTWLLLLYLLIVIGGALALWLFTPEDVKKVIYETYVNPP
jgi:hypothetical protein